MDSNENKKVVPIRNQNLEDGAEELSDSERMQPYIRLANAVVSQESASIREAITEIAGLPLEQRYLWRVLSALELALADFDNMNLAIDRKTLRPEDRERVVDLIERRPLQFCLFLKGLLGDEVMEEMMTKAIDLARRAKQVG